MTIRTARNRNRTEVLKRLTDYVFTFDAALSRDTGAEVRGDCQNCRCHAFVWRLSHFPRCGREGCGHDIADHDL